MKNRLSIVIGTLCMTVFVIIASVISVFADNKKEENDLILKEYNGSVALFQNDEIKEIYDEIVISVLPDSDKEILKSGIVIESEEQLASIIEDYDG